MSVFFLLPVLFVVALLATAAYGVPGLLVAFLIGAALCWAVES